MAGRVAGRVAGKPPRAVLLRRVSEDPSPCAPSTNAIVSVARRTSQALEAIASPPVSRSDVPMGPTGAIHIANAMKGTLEHEQRADAVWRVATGPRAARSPQLKAHRYDTNILPLSIRNHRCAGSIP